MQVTSNNLAPGDENKSLTLTSLNKSASSGKFSENSSVDPLYLTHSRNFAQDQDRVYYICLLFKCIHHMNTTRIYRKCDLVWELIQVLFQHWFPSIMLFFRNNQVTGFFYSKIISIFFVMLKQPFHYWQALRDCFWLKNTAGETQLMKFTQVSRKKTLLCFRIILPFSSGILLLSSFGLERKFIENQDRAHRSTLCITWHTLKRKSRYVRNRNDNFQFNPRESTYCETSIP